MAHEEIVEFGEEPGSPATKLFHSKRLNCYIIAMMGFKIKFDVEAAKEKSLEVLRNVPRFSSLLVKDEKHGKMTWVPTTINIQDHVFCPDLEGVDQENTSESLGDEIVDEYIERLSSKPMDINKPLWEVHILNLKTSSANATGIFWIHHSLGDGISLISVLLALTRKTSDPESLPSIPTHLAPTKNMDGNNISGRIKGFFSKLWEVLLVIFYSFYDISLFLATLFFFRDTESPIKGGSGVEGTRKRVMQRDVSLDDIKLVKTATNATINDVVVGVTQAGLSRYLNMRYESHNYKDHGAKKKANYLPEKMRVRAALIFNIRSSAGIQVLADMIKTKSKAKWGNLIGYSFMPLTIALKNDPLVYIREAQAITKRKKQSLESRFAYAVVQLGCKFLGDKVTSRLTHRLLFNTTICLSNVVGPREEVSLFGHPLTYIAPSVHGLPFALLIHYQSYMNKMTIVFTYDPLVIPDPRQLFDDIEDSLQDIKNAAISRGVGG